MARHPIYDVTSIGRPLDKSFATNRAVSLLMPVGAVAAIGLALLQGETGLRLLGAAVTGAVLVFGAWALARELAPDDNAAAFVAIALSLGTLPLLASLSFLLLFTTMFLVRIVNRSTGLAARVTDSVAVTILVLVTVHFTENPCFAVIAAFAFALDALLTPPLRRQWVFAGLCLGGMVLWQLTLGAEIQPRWSQDLGIGLLLATITAMYLATLLQTRAVRACGDVTSDRLSVQRVRMGMLICLIVAAQGLVAARAGLAHTAVLWASMAGVASTGFVALVRGRTTK